MAYKGPSGLFYHVRSIHPDWRQAEKPAEDEYVAKFGSSTWVAREGQPWPQHATVTPSSASSTPSTVPPPTAPSSSVASTALPQPMTPPSTAVVTDPHPAGPAHQPLSTTPDAPLDTQNP
ncbi:uncharacterized protein MONBRDRAFT_11495 [Monosiga brevicollis MX1]|uniref:Uncharacterized protein n=1 Tax=Monosiga brevicollis TaxID=81824 RepID=A9V9B8_MONBE|nr:uncharacterized protein MONBRDRAFT_11495 [Monosiga brevicollis MX1]EDQ85833.1 predicted protein [Monosiga brevicollis MX1]|eukprot:XP_001749312.1 hypothetical protein [Monosiga brevicollis MX1]